jgi:branched-chain amino acid transport system permease protein
MNIEIFLQLIINGLMLGGVYALVASGFTLILGVLKIFNFAQGQFYMLGAFVTYLVASSLGMPYPLAILASFAAMGLLGLLFYYGIVKWSLPYGFYHAMLITGAFGTIISQSSVLSFGTYSKVVDPIFPGMINLFGGINIVTGKVMVIVFAIIVMLILYYFMKTKIGISMLAAAENKDVAGLQGINTKRVFWVTMVIGCALCGAAGAFMAPIIGASLAMSGISVSAMLVVIIGGMGSMSGALIAAFLLGIVESFAFHFVGELNLLVIYALLAVLIYFRPGGLLGKPLPLPGQ